MYIWLRSHANLPLQLQGFKLQLSVDNGTQVRGTHKKRFVKMYVALPPPPPFLFFFVFVVDWGQSTNYKLTNPICYVVYFKWFCSVIWSVCLWCIFSLLVILNLWHAMSVGTALTGHNARGWVQAACRQPATFREGFGNRNWVSSQLRRC